MAAYTSVVDLDLAGTDDGGRAPHEPAALAGEPVDRDLVVPVVGGLVADPPRDRRPVGLHRATCPARPGMRRASASALPARIIILVGMQPQ